MMTLGETRCGKHGVVGTANIVIMNFALKTLNVLDAGLTFTIRP
jgi:hypothetical protein